MPSSRTNHGYFLQVEQVGTKADGQTRFCWPEVPDYASADAQYQPGLAEPPEGGGTAWKLTEATFTVSGMEFLLIPGLGGYPWMKTRSVALTEIREIDDGVTASETVWDIMHNPADVGIAVDDVLHVGTEAVFVTIAPALPQITVTRGELGTKALAHNNGEDILDHPPSLIGRRVTCVRFPIVGGSSGDEVTVYRGYVAAEPAADTDLVVIKARSMWRDVEINRNPKEAVYLFPNGDPDSGAVTYVGGPRNWRPDTLFGTGRTQVPTFRTDGGNWWVPAVDSVYEGAYTTPPDSWDFNPAPVVGKGMELPDNINTGLQPDDPDDQKAYEVVLSDADRDYAPFGFNDGADTPSDHPVVIFLNLLASRDGNNTLGGGRTNYDRGSGLAPFSVDVDIADIDQDAFEELIERTLPGLRAARLWLGGPSPVRLESLAKRLFSPWFVAAGVNRSGKWTVLRMHDIYPDDDIVTLDETNIVDPEVIGHVTIGRELDSVELQTDPSPGGKSSTSITINELTGRTWFRPHVGRALRFPNSPFARRHFSRDDPAWLAVARIMRRVSDRLPVVSCRIDDTFITQSIDVGDAVSIQHTAVFNPATGSQLVSGDLPLEGLVIQVDPNWDEELALIHIAVTASGKTSKVAPCGTVSSWASVSKQLTLDANDYTPALLGRDASFFQVGGAVCLMDDRGVLKTDDGSSSAPTITSVEGPGNNILVLSGDFVEPGGSPTYTPLAGDVITYARFNNQPAAVTTRIAFGADGGSPGTTPGLGSSDVDPYQFGD